jgi:trigger factor
MKVKLQEPTASRRILEVEIPAEEVQQEKERIAREYARRLSIPGFRKGRAPASVVRRRFQREIEQEVVEKLTKESSWKVIDEHELVPLEPPVVEEVCCVDGEPLTFRTTFEVRPAIELGTYRGLEVVRRRAAVDDDVVERNLQAFREQNARLEPAEGRPLQEGDVAVADLQALGQDGAPAGEPQRGAHLDLGADGVPEKLREQLLGMEVGSQREVTLGGRGEAAESGAEEGRPERRYQVELLAVRTKVFPELDDDFARDQGEFESMEDLRTKLRQDLERRADRQADEEVREQLVRQLVESHSIQAPDAMVEQEQDRMLQRMVAAMSAQGVDPAGAGMDWQAKRAELREHAEMRSRADLLLDEIAKAENLEVSDDEILEALKEEAARLKTSAPALRARLAKEGRLESLKTKMLRQKSLDLVEGSANIMTKGNAP